MKHVKRMSHSDEAVQGAWRLPQAGGTQVSQTAVWLSLSLQISIPGQSEPNPIALHVGEHIGGTSS